MNAAASFADRVDKYQARVESTLDHWLPDEHIVPSRLHAAMRYACLGGGKRLRPLLVYATGEVLGIEQQRLDAAAAAVELIHAYSLVHDDLPAMDDDDLRRNMPTCHRAFDEATAILAGDALQTLAFQVLAQDTAMQIEPAARVEMIRQLAEASGACGMAGGQAIDLDSVGKSLTLAELENMHIHKTGALIRACVLLASNFQNPADSAQRDALDRYAKRIGLAFQIHDDILDEESDTHVLGKNTGSDRALNKPTFPSIIGMSESKQRAKELTQEAVAALSLFEDQAKPLIWLAWHITQRES